ncbi:M28 family peptidase [Luteimonas sp. 50]|uniref:M28 family peptidase n=1 Tax=Cognatiluteimonas sedimenti TaxID=2927791 RepID=A0ABT0A5L2_9GAMM|nr:M28 family peptidase [Lysobacter sedimenti]MCJ0826273.1 M28 family peptidase [Lysobacter sedimenti]
MPSALFRCRLVLAPLLLATGIAGCERAPAPPPAAAPAAPSESAAAGRIRADVAALADDHMQGRRTGTPGFDRAAEYVAGRMRALGLRPGGDHGGWFQQVPLLQSQRLREGAALVVDRHGRDIALRFGEQFLPAPGFDAGQETVTAPAVFVGYGIVAPALDHDDLAGLDLHGRIALLYRGAPDTFTQDQRALHGDDADKLAALAQRGAVGAVFVGTAPDEASAPWASVAAAWQRPAMRLRDAEGSPGAGASRLRVVASVAAAAADLLFAEQPRSAAELFLAAQRGTGHGFALPGTLTLSARSRISRVDSRNVVARLPGADPARRAQALVYSAHLDHLGSEVAGSGDRIHNGAIDNALGVAILLETARTLASGPAPARTQVFVATTGEEQGLLGARWFAAHPGAAAPVAALNLDMPVLTAPTRDVVAIGGEHSSLQASLQAAAKALAVPVSPDPYPEEHAFVRGDHYAFVRAGVPTLYLTGGSQASDKARDPVIALRYYLRNCYHRPCDDATQPIRYDDAARLAQLAAGFGRQLDAEASAPQWLRGDPFGQRYGGTVAP